VMRGRDDQHDQHAAGAPQRRGGEFAGQLTLFMCWLSRVGCGFDKPGPVDVVDLVVMGWRGG